MSYFIDDNGQIWSINQHGESNHPKKLLIEGDRVSVLGDCDGEPGAPIDDTFVLHPTLMSLAIAIEHTPAPSEDGSVNIEQAVADGYQRITSFHEYWLDMNSRYPEEFPLKFERDNAGLWNEQMNDHSDDAPRELNA